MPVLDVNTGKLLEYLQMRIHTKLSKICNESYYNYLGRLCRGIGEGPDGISQRIKDTGTFNLFDYENIPINRRKEITYTKLVCIFRPPNYDPNHTWITTGGNRIF